MMSAVLPRLPAFSGKIARSLLGLAVAFSWGCSGTIETNSGSDSLLGIESTDSNGQGAQFSASPLSPDDQLNGFCGEPGVLTGRVPAPRGVLEDVSLYQSVEISLLRPQAVKVEVVSGRDTLLRIFVNPESAISDGARLTIQEPNQLPVVFEDWATFSMPSDRGRLASTYNFHLNGKYISPEAQLSVELFQLADCELHVPTESVARFPERGEYSLDAREVGALRLVIVPIRYWGDGSGRLPDVSRAHLDELRHHLGAMFPVPLVELQVHDEVDTNAESLEEILGQVMSLRAAEKPAPQVGYFGLVNPSETMDAYCGGSCVAGVSAVGSASGHASSGVAVGFRGATAETFLHELGHMHRLEHAPCGDPVGADVKFPHTNATIGVWGYDRRSRRLIDPSGDARDFMSYCDPAWISDANTQNLIERLALSNSLPRADIVKWEANSGSKTPGER